MGKSFNTGLLTNGIAQDSSNNIGIGGAANASYKLDVIGNGKFTSSNFPIDIYGTTNNYGLRINSVQAPTLLLYSSNANSSNRNWGIFTNSEVYGDFDIRQSNAKDGDMTVGANSTSRLYIRNNGNVGIGTSSPGTKLDVSGVIRSNTFVNAYDGTRDIYMNPAADFGLGSLPAIQVASNHGLQFATNNSLKMYITSGGQVLVNKTSSLDSSRKIDVDGNYYSSGSGAGYFWENRSNAANHYGWYTSSGTIYLWNGSANAASINPSTGAYTALNPSDIRIKDNVRNYNKGLNELLQINVKEWEYNGKAGTFVGEKGVGFIANELEQVIPEWVGEFETFLNAEDEEKTKLKNININELPYMMLKAIQEQQEIINQLSAKVTALENK